jgi:putative tryptophan/tyrosine transport system substrate-binding protein
MHSRRRLLVLGAAALAAPLVALGQEKPRRIGFLALRSRSTPSSPDIYYEAFVQGMRELGYVEGKNLVIEWRFADGKYERIPGLAAELVQIKPEVIVTHSSNAMQALQRATTTIPIVTAAVADPIADGFAASLPRPGGNITGLSNISMDIYPKQLELLKTMLPGLSRVAFLVNPGNPRASFALKRVQAVATKRGVKILPVEAGSAEEIERGFAAMKRERAEAVMVQGESFFVGQRRQILSLAAQYRLPSMFVFRQDAEDGGLMSYGANLAALYRRAATYVDRILKGAKAGELPIEQPSIIHFAINRKTAKALGIAIPQELLHRADLVIE